MKLSTISTLVVFYIYAITCHAATITLFQAATATTFASLSHTFTPIGVGADGATTYSMKEVASVFVMNGPPPEPVTINGTILSTASTHFKTTFTSDPLAIHATVVADASHYSRHISPVTTGRNLISGEEVDCNFDGQGGASCVGELWFTGSTVTTTFTGTVVPWYTLVAADAHIDKGNGAASGSGRAWLGVVVGLFSGCLLVL